MVRDKHTMRSSENDLGAEIRRPQRHRELRLGGRPREGCDASARGPELELATERTEVAHDRIVLHRAELEPKTKPREEKLRIAPSFQPATTVPGEVLAFRLPVTTLGRMCTEAGLRWAIVWKRITRAV